MTSPVSVQGPSGGPDLSFRNPRDRVFVQSDETGDGDTKEGFRFIIKKVAGKNTVAVQAKRIGGAYNDSAIATGANSVNIGPALTASATGRFIHTIDSAEPNERPDSLIPETPFNDADGSAFLEVPVVDKLKTVSIFPGPPVSEIINTTISQLYTPTTDEVVDSGIHQSGSLAATAEVIYTIYAGPTNSAPIIFGPFNFLASHFPANQPIPIDYGKSFRLHRNLTHLIELISVNSFSLETNGAGDILTDFDLHDFTTLQGVTDNLTLSNDLELTFSNELELTYSNYF